MQTSVAPVATLEVMPVTRLVVEDAELPGLYHALSTVYGGNRPVPPEMDALLKRVREAATAYELRQERSRVEANNDT